jgi:hypothetical protein
MKISVLDGKPISVTTESGEFQVGPVCLNTRRSTAETGCEPWAIVAVSSDPLSSHRFLSKRFPTANEAHMAFLGGFEVLDPAREPSLTVSKIVAGMLKSPKARFV